MPMSDARGDPRIPPGEQAALRALEAAIGRDIPAVDWVRRNVPYKEEKGTWEQYQLGYVVDGGHVQELSLCAEVQEEEHLESICFFNAYKLIELPAAITDLKELRRLCLRSNNRFKKLPENMRNFIFLKELNLSGCDTIAALPGSIGQLAALTELNLQGCKALAALPVSIGQLAALTELDLSYCKALAALPESIGQLATLTKLDLSYCEALAALPESIGQLAALTKLGLHGYEALAALPESLANLKHLKIVRFSSEKITQLPDWLKKLTSLTELDLSHCEALAALPESIRQLASLTKLDLSCCKALAALPESIGQLAALSELNLFDCRALAALPESIEQLATLTKLDLSFCEALAALPESIGQLAALVELDLYDCKALAALPGSIGQLAALTELNLSDCRALAALPGSIARLHQLKRLDLQHCGLTAIPPVLRHLPPSIELELDGNPFSSEEREMARNTFPVIKDYLRKKDTITLFLSHAVREYEPLRIGDLVAYLREQPEIYAVTICEDNLQGNIDEFQSKRVQESHLVLFVATLKSVYNSKAGCEAEARAAVGSNIPVIPIIGPDMTWEEFERSDVSRVIGRELGIKLDLVNFNTFCADLYGYIMKYKRRVNMYDKEAAKIDRLCLRLAGLLTDFVSTPASREVVARRAADLDAVMKDLDSTDKAICQQIGAKVVYILARETAGAAPPGSLEDEIRRLKDEISSQKGENSSLKDEIARLKAQEQRP